MLSTPARRPCRSRRAGCRDHQVMVSMADGLLRGPANGDDGLETPARLWIIAAVLGEKAKPERRPANQIRERVFLSEDLHLFIVAGRSLALTEKSGKPSLMQR